MDALNRGVNPISQGLGSAVNGYGNIAKGVLTLDPKKAGAGVAGVINGQLDIGHGANNLTPAGFAGNTLLNGATDKAVRLAQTPVRTVVDKTLPDPKKKP
jgi:hypothetical protein